MTIEVMANQKIFKNSSNVAVEHLELPVTNDGVVKSYPALSSHWVTQRALSVYVPAPRGPRLALGALQTWKDSIQWYIDDLKWLLSMEYYKFWSYIIHYSPCMDMLVSFLQEASPPYLLPHEDRSVVDLYNQAYQKVLIVFSRLVTKKESESEWMNASYLGQILYEKFIFTIPIIWDLCLLYGTNNSTIITKIVKIVFRLQPKYYDDLGSAILFLKQIFNFIALQVDSRNAMDALPPTLPETFQGFSQSFGGLNSHQSNGMNLNFAMLRDLALHLVDCTVTLRTFLELHAPSRHIIREKEFHASIINLYENTLPKMYEKVVDLGVTSGDSVDEILGQLNLIRVELVDSYRFIIATTIDDILSGKSDIKDNVSIYLTMITDSLSEKAFIKDYDAAYPIDGDLDVLCQAYSDMDPVKCDFIRQAVVANCLDDLPVLNKKDPSENINVDNSLNNGFELPHEVDPADQSVEIPEEAKTQSLISEVKDILPHLGDGFILKCLEHYGFNSERVVNSVLEGTLDESLQGIDHSLPIIPKDPLDAQFLETGIDRLNVFDNDEFDVMTRDNIDPSKVHKGKRKSKHKNLADMLDDKSYVREMKDVYSKFSLVTEESDLYDDEYDDTYDGGAPELVNEASAEAERRPAIKSHPIRVMNECLAESDDESDDESKPCSSNIGPPKDSFCGNPEEVRARYQAKRDMKYGVKPPSTDRDVIGKTKGQGQDKDVLINRQKKAATKSSRANHNRRSGAQWKRTQGMMPS